MTRQPPPKQAVRRTSRRCCRSGRKSDVADRRLFVTTPAARSHAQGYRSAKAICLSPSADALNSTRTTSIGAFALSEFARVKPRIYCWNHFREWAKLGSYTVGIIFQLSMHLFRRGRNGIRTPCEKLERNTLNPNNRFHRFAFGRN